MKEKGTVYKIKEGADLNKFAEKGYEIVQVGSYPVMIKIIPQDFDGELVQGTLKNIYNNNEWRKRIYSYHKKAIKEALDLDYKRGKAVITDKFRHVLTDWRIQVEIFDDAWLGFKSMDKFEQKIYYNSCYLDRYCADEIKDLLADDLIELIEIEQEVPDKKKQDETETK